MTLSRLNDSSPTERAVAVQRKMQASMGVLSGTLYMTVFSQRVVPWGGGSDDEGPDAQHWFKVLVCNADALAGVSGKHLVCK